MDKNQYQLLKKYADLLLRWDKVIIVVVLVSISCGFVVYLKTPKVYQSSALIMYEQQQIKPSKLSPEVSKQIAVMVNTVSQHVTSRGSLEKIVKEFDLYKDALEKLPMEDVIVIMRDKYINIFTSKKSGDVFEVSFRNEDPRKAMLVTNDLASKFIEENLRSREERASETTDYVQYELKIAKETIDKKEELMRDYKLQYYNEMPDQRVGNMNRLNALQEQYQVVQSNIQNLEQTRLLVQQQNDLQKKNLARRSGKDESNSDLYDLATARQAMNNLLAKYTPEHPSVKQLAKQIQQLEEEQGLTQNSFTRDGENKGSGDSPMSAQLSDQLKEIELNLKSLRSNGDKILEQVRKYQQWVDNTPVREAEWASITRDYYELKKHYENLVSQSLAAESAETLERRQKGSQFRIVDSAYLPVKPLKPDFSLIMLSSLALGLGGGVAIILFFDFLNTSFKDANEVEQFLKLPVLCSVPMIVTPKEKKRSRVISLLSYFLCGLFFVGLVSVMIVFWQKGVIVI